MYQNFERTNQLLTKQQWRIASNNLLLAFQGKEQLQYVIKLKNITFRMKFEPENNLLVLNNEFQILLQELVAGLTDTQKMQCHEFMQFYYLFNLQMPSHTSTTLPLEIYQSSANYMSFYDLKSFRQTCSRFFRDPTLKEINKSKKPYIIALYARSTYVVCNGVIFA